MHSLRVLFLTFCGLGAAWGDIQFEDVSQHAGIHRIGESWGSAWGDFDGDGYLDLWATNHKHKPSLYRNNRDGSFTNIIDQVWRAYAYADTHGVAWADFDNDADQDLIVLSGSGGGRNNTTNRKQHNHFYINRDGRLVESAAALGVGLPLLRGRTPLWLDSNRDGHLDLLLTGMLREDVACCGGTDENSNGVTSFMLEQTVGPAFTQVGASVGFDLQESASFAQLSDITDDGNLDVIIGTGAYPRAVFQVSKTGGFQDITETLHFPHLSHVTDAVFADFNGDLRPDVFLARDIYRSYINTIDERTLKLYIRNNQGETGMRFSTDAEVYFEIFSVWEPRLSLVSIGEHGHDIEAFDGAFVGADSDRNVASFRFQLSPEDPRVIGLKRRPAVDLFGIYVGYDPDRKQWTLLYHKSSHTNNWTGFEAVISAHTDILDVAPVNFTHFDLFHHPRSVLLTKATHQRFERTASFSDGRSIAAGDFDNDMDIDIYLVRSSSAGNLPNRLYENQGNGVFVEHRDIGAARGSTAGRGQSVAMADYDRDGYLDLFLTNGRGAYPFNKGPDQLLRNTSRGNNWIQIDLEGRVSNRDGIGAKLFVTTPDGRTQLRESAGGLHYSQQDQKRIHFGLAGNEKVSSLSVYWPSGLCQTLKNLPVNRVLRVVEGGSETPIPADVNSDGVVDLSDLLFVGNYIGEPAATAPSADVNRDGKIDIEDILAVIESGLEPMPGAAPSKCGETLAAVSALYHKIETLSADSPRFAFVKRFLGELLVPTRKPLETQLYTNYPNPFNPETWIPYQLAEDAEVTLCIYDASGHVVRTVFSGYQPAGYYLNRSRAAYWDGKNALGERVASGIYFYQLQTDEMSPLRKMVILK